MHLSLRMLIAFPAAFFLLLVVLLGCTSAKELTRSSASTLIQKSAKFGAPVAEAVPRTDFRTFDFTRTGRWDVVDALLTLGYLVEQGNQITLTAKGEAACKESPKDPNPQIVGTFPIAHRELEKVTGITDSTRPGMKEAKFTWRFSLTALGKELSSKSPKIGDKYSPGSSHDGTAFFRLYDDGWRLEQVAF